MSFFAEFPGILDPCRDELKRLTIAAHRLRVYSLTIPRGTSPYYPFTRTKELIAGLTIIQVKFKGRDGRMEQAFSQSRRLRERMPRSKFASYTSWRNSVRAMQLSVFVR